MGQPKKLETPSCQIAYATCLIPPSNAVSPTISAAPSSSSFTVSSLSMSGHSCTMATTLGARASPPLVNLFFSTIAARLAVWICFAVLRLLALLCAAVMDAPDFPFFPLLPSILPFAASRRLPLLECLLLNDLFDCFSDGRCECPPPLVGAIPLCDMVRGRRVSNWVQITTILARYQAKIGVVGLHCYDALHIYPQLSLQVFTA